MYYILTGKKTLIKENDQSFVTMRPKKYVCSSGSVWASNILSWYHKLPQHIQLSDEDCHVFSIPLRSICTKLKDIASYFIDTTTNEDITAMSKEKDGSQGKFRKYEIERLHWLSQMLKKVQPDAGVKEDERELFECLTSLIQCASASAGVMESLLHESEDIEEDFALEEYANICEKLQSIVDFIEKNKFRSNFRFQSTQYAILKERFALQNLLLRVSLNQSLDLIQTTICYHSSNTDHMRPLC